jgi:hypothetical protein
LLHWLMVRGETSAAVEWSSGKAKKTSLGKGK